MKSKIFKNLVLLLFLLGTSQLIGQEIAEFTRTDVVYLKNGSIFRGQIEFYEVGKELRLRIEPGKAIVVKASSIRRIIQLASEEEKVAIEKKMEKEYKFKENGIYYAANLGYIGGNQIFGQYTGGYNAHFQIGIQHRRILGTGLGVGVDYYNTNLGSIIPVYGEVRGYLKKSNISPYYHLAGGIGFPITSETARFQAHKPGYYLSPSLGIRFGGSANENMTLSLGLQWQRASYLQDLGDGISKNVDRYTYRRFNFKIGILF